MTSLALTTTDLRRTLIHAIKCAAVIDAEKISRLIETQVTRMVNKPLLISEAVYGEPCWPATDICGGFITPENVLADCRKLLGKEPFGKRRDALNIAQLALMQIRDGGE